MNKNIYLITAIKISKWLMLYMPIVKLFMEENGLGNFELLSLHAIYSAVIALVEIPSGYLSDRWGRKNTLMLGTLLGATGFSIYSAMHGFYGFLFAEIALGIGQACISGTDSAILYDTLAEKGKRKKYLQFEGKLTAVGNFSEAAAGIIVSLLAFSVYRNYYYLQTGLALLGFFATLFLYEPRVHEKEVFRRNMFQILKHNLLTSFRIRNLILFSSLMGIASLTMAWFAQILFFEYQMPEHWYGYAWAVLQLIVAAGSLSAHRIAQKTHPPILLFAMLFIMCGGFVALGFTKQLTSIAIPIFLVFYFTRGWVHPLLKGYLNDLITSDMRATTLSIRSLLIRLLFFGVGPLAGYYSDAFNPFVVLLCMGSIMLVLGIILYIALQYQVHESETH